MTDEFGGREAFERAAQITPVAYRAQVGSRFQVEHADGPVALLLADVSDAHVSGGFVQFSLFFHGPPTGLLSQGIMPWRTKPSARWRSSSCPFSARITSASSMKRASTVERRKARFFQPGTARVKVSRIEFLTTVGTALLGAALNEPVAGREVPRAPRDRQSLGLADLREQVSTAFWRVRPEPPLRICC